MISKEEVKKIANLARLELTEQEIEKMQRDLADILGYIDQLNQVNVSGVDMKNDSIILGECLREDMPLPQNLDTTENMIAQSPGREGNHIKVKEILT